MCRLIIIPPAQSHKRPRWGETTINMSRVQAASCGKLESGLWPDKITIFHSSIDEREVAWTASDVLCLLWRHVQLWQVTARVSRGLEDKKCDSKIEQLHKLSFIKLLIVLDFHRVVVGCLSTSSSRKRARRFNDCNCQSLSSPWNEAKSAINSDISLSQDVDYPSIAFQRRDLIALCTVFANLTLHNTTDTRTHRSSSVDPQCQNCQWENKQHKSEKCARLSIVIDLRRDRSHTQSRRSNRLGIISIRKSSMNVITSAW